MTRLTVAFRNFANAPNNRQHLLSRTSPIRISADVLTSMTFHRLLGIKVKRKVHPCTGTDLCTGRTVHRGSRGIDLLFLDHDTRRRCGSASRPGRSLPPGKTRYPLYRRLGGPKGRSRQVRKISPPPGFDPRTVQPVASRYTDYATRPLFVRHTLLKQATNAFFSILHS